MASKYSSGRPPGRRAARRAGGRHNRPRLYRVAGLSFSSAALTVVVLSALGLLMASGATTGALWLKQAKIEGGTVTAGDLTVEKCESEDKSTWQDPSGVLSGGRLADLASSSFEAKNGGSIRIIQCVAIKADGDNLAVNLDVDWAGFSLPSGIDPASTYYLAPFGDTSTPPSAPLIGAPHPAMTIPATNQSDPTPAPGERKQEWKVVMDIGFTGLTSGAGPVTFPEFEVRAEQTRTGAGF